MFTVAHGVVQIPLLPGNALSAYLIDGKVLVDTGMPHQRKRMVRTLRGVDLEQIVLTHAHADHAGTVAALSAEKGCSARCGEEDLEALAAGTSPPVRLGRMMEPVQRALVRYRGLRANPLSDGDDIGGGFVAVATPGHTPGHHSLWRESDRVLIAGDALLGMSPGKRAGVHPPLSYQQVDPVAVHASICRLAQLEPEVIAFGHGRVARTDVAERLARMAATPAPVPKL